MLNDLLKVASAHKAVMFAVQVISLLRLAHAAVAEALLEYDIAWMAYRCLTCNNQVANCATLLVSCGSDILKAVQCLQSRFEPKTPHLTGFAVRISPLAHIVDAKLAKKHHGEGMLLRDAAAVLARD